MFLSLYAFFVYIFVVNSNSFYDFSCIFYLQLFLIPPYSLSAFFLCNSPNALHCLRSFFFASKPVSVIVCSLFPLRPCDLICVFWYNGIVKPSLFVLGVIVRGMLSASALMHNCKSLGSFRSISFLSALTISQPSIL